MFWVVDASLFFPSAYNGSTTKRMVDPIRDVYLLHEQRKTTANSSTLSSDSERDIFKRFEARIYYISFEYPNPIRLEGIISRYFNIEFYQ
jgi:hypothetical protein